MKKWENPEIKTLNAKFTFENEIEECKSEASCGQSALEAVANKGKGCSVTTCIYYLQNNNGNGNGGKCNGATIGGQPEEPPIS